MNLEDWRKTLKIPTTQFSVEEVIARWEKFKKERDDVNPNISGDYVKSFPASTRQKEMQEAYDTKISGALPKSYDEFYEKLKQIGAQMPYLQIIVSYTQGEFNGLCEIYATCRLLGIEGRPPDQMVHGENPISPFNVFGSKTLPVPTPHVGDLIVYLNERGLFTHYGIVVSVRGTEIMIDSKWGHLPYVYRHALDVVPTEYGNRFAFFRPYERI